MLIKIGDFDCTEVWDGVFYKKLSNDPKVSDWEIRTIIEFIEYEEKHGRTCSIECEDKDALRTILNTSCSRGEIAKQEIDWSWSGRWGISQMKRS